MPGKSPCPLSPKSTLFECPHWGILVNQRFASSMSVFDVGCNEIKDVGGREEG